MTEATIKSFAVVVDDRTKEDTKEQKVNFLIAANLIGLNISVV